MSARTAARPAKDPSPPRVSAKQPAKQAARRSRLAELAHPAEPKSKFRRCECVSCVRGVLCCSVCVVVWRRFLACTGIFKSFFSKTAKWWRVRP